MNSDVVFERVLNRRFLEARHTDRAPGRYESLALLPSVDSAAYSTVVYDNFGGARRFFGKSSRDTVVLVRDTMEANARPEQFTFQATSANSYWYAWHVRRTVGQPLVLGDSATCRRADTAR